MNRLFSSKYCAHLTPVEKSEPDLRNYLKDNWNSIFPDLTFIKDEYTLSGNVRKKDLDGRIDILAFNRKSKKFVVVELKKGFDRNIGSQANDYRDFIEDKFLEIYVNVKEELGVGIPQQSKIINDDIELILVAHDFAEKDIVRAKKTDNITCIKYQWFQAKDDLILSYEYLNNPPQIESTISVKEKPAKVIKEGYPAYVVNNVKSLNKPGNLISKMLGFIQKSGNVAKGELRKECVRSFGCLNGKSGAINGNISTLKHIGFIKETGRGETSTLQFITRKNPSEVRSISPSNSNSKLLSLKVNGRLVQGSTVPELYQSALEFILNNNMIDTKALPYATSKKRYLLAKKSVHPNGNEFVKPILFKGYYMETHKSREEAMKCLIKLLKDLGGRISV